MSVASRVVTLANTLKACYAKIENSKKYFSKSRLVIRKSITISNALLLMCISCICVAASLPIGLSDTCLGTTISYFGGIIMLIAVIVLF